MAGRRLVWTAACVLLASHFAIAYVNGTQSWIDTARYARGTERLPFQYRALTGWLLRAGSHLPGLAAIAARASRKMADPLNILLAGIVFLATLWIIRCALLASRYVFASETVARIAALSIMLPLYVGYEALANGYRLSYAYDLPSLALFFTGLVCILYRQRVRLLVVFVASTLSRETSLYLIPIYLCWAAFGATGRRYPWRAIWAAPDWIVAVLMGVIWVVIRAVLKIIYAGNPLDSTAAHLSGMGYGTQVELLANLAALANPLQWPGLLSSLCWLWLPVLCFWHLIPDGRLRAAIMVTTPIVVVTMFVAGRITEPRVFMELTLLFWLAVLHQVQAANGKALL